MAGTTEDITGGIMEGTMAGTTEDITEDITAVVIAIGDPFLTWLPQKTVTDTTAATTEDTTEDITVVIMAVGIIMVVTMGDITEATTVDIISPTYCINQLLSVYLIPIGF